MSPFPIPFQHCKFQEVYKLPLPPRGKTVCVKGGGLRSRAIAVSPTYVRHMEIMVHKQILSVRRGVSVYEPCDLTYDTRRLTVSCELPTRSIC